MKRNESVETLADVIENDTRIDCWPQRASATLQREKGIILSLGASEPRPGSRRPKLKRPWSSAPQLFFLDIGLRLLHLDFGTQSVQDFLY